MLKYGRKKWPDFDLETYLRWPGRTSRNTTIPLVFFFTRAPRAPGLSHTIFLSQSAQIYAYVNLAGCPSFFPLSRTIRALSKFQMCRVWHQCSKRHATLRHRTGAKPRVRGRAAAHVPSYPGGLCTAPTPVAARPRGREILSASMFLNTRCS